MFMEAYRKAVEVISKKPMRLWGLSLLYGLLVILASVLTSPIFGLGLAAGYVLEAGMAKIYLDGFDGKEVNSDQLFAGFKRFLRVAGGMAWRGLWVLIWALIPVVGPIIAIVKWYSYAFVPYILMNQPEVTATEALRLSMKLTNGKKGQMFLADFVLCVGLFVVFLILSMLTLIPFIGILFGLITLLAYIIVIMFVGLFVGLYKAYFYKMPQVQPAPAAAPAPEAAQPTDEQ